jgi:predicted phage baseplate assembly protein
MISFGDGLKGLIPPVVAREGGNIRAREYRVGGGVRGNLGTKTIDQILEPESFAGRVENYWQASGGTEAETLEAAQQRIRQDLKQPYRTVRDEDFKILAQRTPGLRLKRVEVLPLYHPHYPAIKMPGAVTLVIVPYTLSSLGALIPPQPSDGFLQTVYRFLEEQRLVSTDLHVISPHFIAVNVELKVLIDFRKSTETIKMNIKNALKKFLDPVEGGPESHGWPLGRTVYKSEIYQLLGGIEGVLLVENLKLTTEDVHRRSAYGERSQDNGNISIPKIGLVFLDQCKITVRGKTDEQ